MRPGPAETSIRLIAPCSLGTGSTQSVIGPEPRCRFRAGEVNGDGLPSHPKGPAGGCDRSSPIREEWLAPGSPRRCRGRGGEMTPRRPSFLQDFPGSAAGEEDSRFVFTEKSMKGRRFSRAEKRDPGKTIGATLSACGSQCSGRVYSPRRESCYHGGPRISRPEFQRKTQPWRQPEDTSRAHASLPPVNADRLRLDWRSDYKASEVQSVGEVEGIVTGRSPGSSTGEIRPGRRSIPMRPGGLMAMAGRTYPRLTFLPPTRPPPVARSVVADSIADPSRFPPAIQIDPHTPW
jgi:hypothetical protein